MPWGGRRRCGTFGAVQHSEGRARDCRYIRCRDRAAPGRPFFFSFRPRMVRSRGAGSDAWAFCPCTAFIP
jgi:hypothetical protein